MNHCKRQISLMLQLMRKYSDRNRDVAFHRNDVRLQLVTRLSRLMSHKQAAMISAAFSNVGGPVPCRCGNEKLSKN